MEDGRSLTRLSQAKKHSSNLNPHSLTMVVADPLKKSTSGKKRSSMDIDKVISSAQERAEEINLSLGSNFPSFVKLMLHSHVAVGFWLGLPSQFCNLNLPKQDSEIILLDENGEEYKTKFLAAKCGLSAGWRGFSIAHKLITGDALVFQLIKNTKFKVYIVRSNSLDEVDGALGLLELDSRPCNGTITKTTNEPATKRSKSNCLHSTAIVQGNDQDISPPLSSSNQLETHSEEVDSEVLEGIKLSNSIVEFQEIKSLKSFNITVNGLILDSEISEYVRTKYYELCCSQNAFLHENLLEGLNFKLVTGIISETVNIADAIRASKVTTSKDELIVWKKSLKAFKELGMNVEFLISQLEKLMNITSEPEQVVELQTSRKAQSERVRLGEEMRNLETRIVELRDAMKKVEMDMGTLKVKVEKHHI